MSAAEKLRALEILHAKMLVRRENVMEQDWLEYHEAHNVLVRALPQIVAVVEAAEQLTRRVEMMPSDESYAVDAVYRTRAQKLRAEAGRIESYDRCKREFHAALAALDSALT